LTKLLTQSVSSYCDRDHGRGRRVSRSEIGSERGRRPVFLGESTINTRIYVLIKGKRFEQIRFIAWDIYLPHL